MMGDAADITTAHDLLQKWAPDLSPEACLAKAGQHLQVAENYFNSTQNISPPGDNDDTTPVKSPPVVTFFEGRPGILALKAALLSRWGRQEEAVLVIRDLETYADVASRLPDGECELLYGRAGYLWALCAIEESVGRGLVRLEIVSQLASRVIHQGLKANSEYLDQRAEGTDRGLHFQWHDSAYLGAAHGLCGILSTLLSVYDYFGVAALGISEDLFHLVVHRGLSGLLASRYPSHNLRSSVDSRGGDRLVQWCHGAPGLLMLLAQALPYVEKNAHLAQTPSTPPSQWSGTTEQGEGQRHPPRHDDSTRRAHNGYLSGELIRDAMEECAQVVWERGLLTKGAGLCHGIAGNAYAFLSCYRATKARKFHRMAAAFAIFLAQRWRDLSEVPDRPYSMYEGLAGAACLCFDLLRPLSSNMPGYEMDCTPKRYSFDSQR